MPNQNPSILREFIQVPKPSGFPSYPRESSKRIFPNQITPLLQLVSWENPSLVRPCYWDAFISLLLNILGLAIKTRAQPYPQKVPVILTLSLSRLHLSTHWLPSSKPWVHSYMPSKTGEGGSHITGTQLPRSHVPSSRHRIFRNLLIRHET